MGMRTRMGTGLIRRVFSRRFFLARLTNLPLLGPVLEWAFFEDDEMIVLAKDNVAEASTKGFRTIKIDAMEEPVETVLPSQVVEHFIRKSRYIFLMNKCMCRDANHCMDFPRGLGCIFLGRGVLKIDKDLGRMVTQEEAIEHLGKCRDAGLVHLIGRNKIDSVWLDTGPKEDLLSLCNCCPCCCLWKMIPDLSPRIGRMVTRMPGLMVEVDDEVCIGCGSCEKSGICYVDAIRIKDGRATINQEFCKGCGRCIEVCPRDSISLVFSDQGFLESSIEKIGPLVDITSK